MENKKDVKNFLILAVLLIALLITAYLAYSHFISNQKLISVKINRVTSEQLNSKVIDLSILSDPRFIRLEEISFVVPNFKSIEVGKDNPFSKTEK